MSKQFTIQVTVADDADPNVILDVVSTWTLAGVVRINDDGTPDESTRRAPKVIKPVPNEVALLRSGVWPYVTDPDQFIDTMNRMEAQLALCAVLQQTHPDEYGDFVVRQGVEMHNRVEDMRTALNVSARQVNVSVTPELFRRQKAKLLAVTRNLLRNVFDAKEPVQ